MQQLVDFAWFAFAGYLAFRLVRFLLNPPPIRPGARSRHRVEDWHVDDGGDD